jgi:hypothetical protein
MQQIVNGGRAAVLKITNFNDLWQAAMMLRSMPRSAFTLL